MSKKNTTKNDIIPVFIKMMAERGYDGATCVRVSKQLCITPPALYKHYRNKKAIHLACCKHIEKYDDIDVFAEARFIVQSALYKSDECDTVQHLKSTKLYGEVGDSFKVLAANYE